ncbi:MAG: Type 1 glutamine amidotransferase-like domain-containing protein [Clostridia bacterium]|nr:Type 1 glutamine amidotransferase-like domain-containing protein [Clostridia bacterium]
MQLILNGGGSDEQVKESYELFARLVKGGKILYIPLAWEHDNMSSCIDWFKGQMLPFGVTNIEQILNPNDITKEKLKSVSGIFIGGGNTYQLLKLLKESCAFDNLKEYIENGGLIMGGSAGALIFGKSIDTCLKTSLNISCTDENLVGLKDTKGFDIINGYSLLVHYKRKVEQLDKTALNTQRLINKGHKLICLPEETSLYIKDNEFTIIGQNPAEIITKNKTQIIEPNNICDLTK